MTYVLFPDEGHGFARPENSMAFNAVTEAFLAEHLGGRYEPIGNDFDGSSITVPAGAAGIPGLAAALPATSKGSGLRRTGPRGADRLAARFATAPVLRPERLQAHPLGWQVAGPLRV